MSSASDSDCDVKPVKQAEPRTRRGLAKKISGDQLSEDDVPPSSETSIYTGKVSQLWNRPHTHMPTSQPQTKRPAKVPKRCKKNSVVEEISKEPNSCSPSDIPCTDDETALEVKDPTPPSTPKQKKQKKRTSAGRMKKGVKSAMNALQKMKTIYQNAEDDVLIVDNDDVLIVDNDPLQPVEYYSMAIKVRLPSGVKKFQIKQNESFAKVFASIAVMENADENDIFMFFNDSTVHIYDSPAALGITVADILDCHIGSIQDNVLPIPSGTELSHIEDKMLIRLNLQMGDSKNRITLNIRTNEPLEKLMREFCQVTGKKFGTLKFSFDGEPLDLSSTPESLDLETDYCIDVQNS